eukprot:scaffold26598_cov84-Isochrysis_galbana.AAC.1
MPGGLRGERRTRLATACYCQSAGVSSRCELWACSAGVKSVPILRCVSTPVRDRDEGDCDEVMDVHHDVVLVSLLQEAVRHAGDDPDGQLS